MEEDSIELIDLLRILWKRKIFIILFALVASLVAGAITFNKPERYETSMIIKPGTLDISPEGKFIYVDSLENIKTYIESGAYNSKINKRMGLDPQKGQFKFKLIQPRNSNVLNVKLEVPDIDQGVKLLSCLLQELEIQYQSHIDLRKAQIDQEISMCFSQLTNSLYEKKKIINKIQAVESNTKDIIKERGMIFKSGKEDVDRLSLLVYTNTIQQNLLLNSELDEQLGELMSGMEDLKLRIETLKLKKQSIENIKVIQAPETSINPVGPGKALYLALAFVFGAFFSVGISFFLEYIHNANSAKYAAA